MDFETSLRRAIKTGNVVIGQNETKECIASGKAKLVVVAANYCPEDFAAFLKEKNANVYTYEGTSKALGISCGRPHFVSALAVIDAGDSDILSIQRA